MWAISPTGIGTLGHTLIVQDFVAAIREGRDPLVDGAEAADPWRWSSPSTRPPASAARVTADGDVMLGITSSHAVAGVDVQDQ